MMQAAFYRIGLLLAPSLKRCLQRFLKGDVTARRAAAASRQFEMYGTFAGLSWLHPSVAMRLLQPRQSLGRVEILQDCRAATSDPPRGHGESGRNSGPNLK